MKNIITTFSHLTQQLILQWYCAFNKTIQLSLKNVDSYLENSVVF